MIRAYANQKLGITNTLESGTQKDSGRNKLLFYPVTTGQEDQIPPDRVVGTTCSINPKPNGTFLLSVEIHNWFPVWVEEGQPL